MNNSSVGPILFRKDGSALEKETETFHESYSRNNSCGVVGFDSS